MKTLNKLLLESINNYGRLEKVRNGDYRIQIDPNTITISDDVLPCVIPTGKTTTLGLMFGPEQRKAILTDEFFDKVKFSGAKRIVIHTVGNLALDMTKVTVPIDELEISLDVDVKFNPSLRIDKLSIAATSSYGVIPAKYTSLPKVDTLLLVNNSFKNDGGRAFLNAFDKYRSSNRVRNIEFEDYDQPQCLFDDDVKDELTGILA